MVLPTRGIERHRQIDLRVGIGRSQRQRSFKGRTRKRGVPERPVRVTQGVVELRSPCALCNRALERCDGLVVSARLVQQ